jgi:selenocysteine-specific elongation factor
MSTPNLIIGTAGHVDHGKTALIRRLTGIETDRLREEQERGLSIDLGFAYFDLPSGAHGCIVDVPGHERFIKNMLAGVTGFDIVLLVIAADEGVMPQTREHLAIIDILGIETGMIVITKADMVDDEWLAMVREDIAAAMEGTVFAAAPVVVTSAKTGQGYDELIGRLDDLARQYKPQDVAGPTRVQIDRVFTIKGHGTVVTGSLLRGALKVEQELEVLPQGKKARVRSVEVHGGFVQEIAAPCRVGVNVAGVDKADLERGSQLVAPGSMKNSWMLDVRLRVIPGADRPLQYRERIRLHHGTAELLGRVVLLDNEALVPGEEALAQLRLEAPVAASRGDSFVIRRYSPAHTIGGGFVIDPVPTKHRRGQQAVLERLHGMEAGSPEELALRWIGDQGRAAFRAADLSGALQLPAQTGGEIIATLVDGGLVVPLTGELYASAEVLDALMTAIQDALREYHDQFPLQSAMPLNRLQAALDRPPQPLLAAALAMLQEQGLVVEQPGGRRLGSHSVQIGGEMQAKLAAIAERARQAGSSPLTRAEVLTELAAIGPAEELLSLLSRESALVPVGEFMMHADALAAAREAIAAHYRASGAFTTSEAREILGASRKYVVAILEHFDAAGVTRRDGDVRHVLRV